MTSGRNSRKTVGMRACLLQDSQGAWFLRYYQSKLKKDHTVPITKELAGLIQAQQQEARARWGEDVKYLFPNRQGRHYTRNSLCAYLEALAEKHQIRDAAGKVWRFRLHQFRHTVGYRMANSGTRLEIIQQFFGHESIEMSRRYSHIELTAIISALPKTLASMIVGSNAPRLSDKAY